MIKEIVNVVEYRDNNVIVQLGDSAVCVGILRFENGVDFHLDDAIILNVNSKPTKYLINQFFKENELKTNTIN